MTLKCIPTRFSFPSDRLRNIMSEWISELLSTIHKFSHNKRKLEVLLMDFFDDENRSIVSIIEQCRNYNNVDMNNNNYVDMIPFCMNIKTNNDAKYIGDAFDYVFLKLVKYLEYDPQGVHMSSLIKKADVLTKIMAKCYKLKEKEENKKKKKNKKRIVEEVVKEEDDDDDEENKRLSKLDDFSNIRIVMRN